MRNELEYLAEIESYVLGIIDDESIFEKKMSTSNQLTNDVVMVKNIVHEIKKQTIVQEVKRAHSNYFLQKNIRWMLGILLLASIITGLSYAMIQNLKVATIKQANPPIVNDATFIYDTGQVNQTQNVQAASMKGPEKKILSKNKRIVFATKQTDNATQDITSIIETVKLNREGLNEVLKNIQPEIQEFDLDPRLNNTVTGKSGTIISIEANSLVDITGKAIQSNVKLILQENYSMGNCIANQLQTMCGNRILQTQGMIYFNAKTDTDTALLIDSKKPVRIEFPVDEKVTTAEIFDGKRDENGIMDWAQIAKPVSIMNENLVVIDIERPTKKREMRRENTFYPIDSLENADRSTATVNNSPYVLYNAIKFGWVNVDYFYSDSKAVDIKLEAKTDKPCLMMSLIIPNKKIVMAAYQQPDSTFRFTRKPNGEVRLPNGEKAIIVATTMLGDQLYFADIHIVFGENPLEKLIFRPSTEKEIKTALNSY